MDVPAIEFRTSWIYNQQWTRPAEFRQPPSPPDWEQREASLRGAWSREGDEILRTVAELTGLSWPENHIIVYLTWGIIPFSDPLTLTLFPGLERTMNTLTHELLHRHFLRGRNRDALEDAWKNVLKPYVDEPPVVKNHIVVHALHELVVIKLYSADRLERIKNEVKKPPYMRAWQIVDELGASYIIQQVFGPPTKGG